MDSWVPAENLKNCEHLLKKFWRHVGVDDQDYPANYEVAAEQGWIGEFILSAASRPCGDTPASFSQKASKNFSVRISQRNLRRLSVNGSERNVENKQRRNERRNNAS
jgi:hypothetical protein